MIEEQFNFRVTSNRILSRSFSCFVLRQCFIVPTLFSTIFCYPSGPNFYLYSFSKFFVSLHVVTFVRMQTQYYTRLFARQFLQRNFACLSVLNLRDCPLIFAIFFFIALGNIFQYLLIEVRLFFYLFIEFFALFCHLMCIIFLLLLHNYFCY